MKRIWKNQTSKTQKRMGGKQLINIKDNTQIAISKWDYSKKPNNWAFYAHGMKEAKKGYPSQRLGVTKKQAIKYLKLYMRKHK